VSDREPVIVVVPETVKVSVFRSALENRAGRHERRAFVLAVVYYWSCPKKVIGRRICLAEALGDLQAICIATEAATVGRSEHACKKLQSRRITHVSAICVEVQSNVRVCGIIPSVGALEGAETPHVPVQRAPDKPDTIRERLRRVLVRHPRRLRTGRQAGTDLWYVVYKEKAVPPQVTHGFPHPIDTTAGAIAVALAHDVRKADRGRLEGAAFPRCSSGDGGERALAPALLRVACTPKPLRWEDACGLVGIGPLDY
jgi:hypothetical protein